MHIEIKKNKLRDIFNVFSHVREQKLVCLYSVTAHVVMYKIWKLIKKFLE